MSLFHGPIVAQMDLARSLAEKANAPVDDRDAAPFPSPLATEAVTEIAHALVNPRFNGFRQLERRLAVGAGFKNFHATQRSSFVAMQFLVDGFEAGRVSAGLIPAPTIAEQHRRIERSVRIIDQPLTASYGVGVALALFDIEKGQKRLASITDTAHNTGEPNTRAKAIGPGTVVALKSLNLFLHTFLRATSSRRVEAARNEAHKDAALSFLHAVASFDTGSKVQQRATTEEIRAVFDGTPLHFDLPLDRVFRTGLVRRAPQGTPPNGYANDRYVLTAQGSEIERLGFLRYKSPADDTR